MKNLFKIRARSVQDPFKIRSRFVQDPFKIHLKSLQNPFKIRSKFFWVSFKIQVITVQEPGTLYHIGAGALFLRASLNTLATQTNIQHEHRLYLAPKEEDVTMGSAIAKTLTANACEAGLAGLQRADIEQRRAPQAALAKLLFVSQMRHRLHNG